MSSKPLSKLLAFTSVGLMAALLSNTGCAVANWLARSKGVIKQMNAKSELVEAPDTAAELSFIYERALTDGYWDFWRKDPGSPFSAATAKEHISDAIWCVGRGLTHSGSPVDVNGCFDDLFAALNLPVARSFQLGDPAAERLERDTIRLEVLLEQSLFTASSWLRANHPEYFLSDSPDQDWRSVREGVETGLRRFVTYQWAHGRRVSRDRSPRALVFSGGAANGAFSAGSIWRLLRLREQCGEPCAADSIDMVAGTSTGALIAILVKDYFAPECPGVITHRTAALKKLTDNYLCSVESDLYCVTDAGIVDLGLLSGKGKETGLVRFSRIAKTIDRFIDDQTFASPVEYFACTVDVRSGRLYHLSSADPADIPDVASLRQAVMASIVEPGMAEPIYHVGPRSAPFTDGGVRSGLPVLGPLRGGAEHLVTFVNQPMDLLPLKRYPPNALEVLFRSFALFTFQPIVGELNQGEYEVAFRRAAEYELCMRRRLQGTDTSYDKADSFCRMEPPAGHPVRPKVAVTPLGSPWIRSLEYLYRSSWIFQPRKVPKGFEKDVGDLTGLNSAGYAFDPASMWRQFVLGAAILEQRCKEIVSTLGWSPSLCAVSPDPTTLKLELARLHDGLEQRGCFAKKTKLEVCPRSEPPVSVP